MQTPPFPLISHVIRLIMAKKDGSDSVEDEEKAAERKHSLVAWVSVCALLVFRGKVTVLFGNPGKFWVCLVRMMFPDANLKSADLCKINSHQNYGERKSDADILSYLGTAESDRDADTTTEVSFMHF